MDVMDTLICPAPGQLEIVQLPAAQRARGEVLVAPRRVGICGTDYHIYAGNQPFLSYPRVMGHELAVEVVEAPAGSGMIEGQVYVVNPYVSCGKCIACRKGKPNCCVGLAVLGVHRDGGMTGLLSLPLANLVRADGLSIDECAMVEFLAIGAHAVRRGLVAPLDRALVVGAGPIGLGVALFASLAGATVTVLDRDTERLAAATTLIPSASTLHADADIAAVIGERTSGEGYDIVFDATGSRQSIDSGFAYIASGGRYVLVSVVKGDITFVDAEFHRREVTLFGSRNATSEDFESVIAAIRDGKAPSDKWITHRTTLAGAVEQLPIWATQKSGLIKAVIEVS